MATHELVPLESQVSAKQTHWAHQQADLFAIRGAQFCGEPHCGPCHVVELGQFRCMASVDAWRNCGKLVGRPFLPLDWLLGFSNDGAFRELVVSNSAARTDNLVKAVRLLRQHGLAVGFPMQTANGEIIFSVGTDTLTEKQILGLLERGELHADGVRRSVEAQASAEPTCKRAASS